MITDLDQRKQALNTGGSYIVQAPAGSGKTELLTRRYLALLAKVDNPEEIVAITFTRKAASEMRLRILQSLLDAENTDSLAKSEFEREGYELALAANARNRECGWHLLETPSRLRVQTIDSLCSSIVRQMPVLSELGVVPQIGEDVDALYQQAIEDMLADLLSGSDDNAGAVSLDCLLRFFDNKVPRLQGMLTDMLTTRDQWRRILKATTMEEQRYELESALQQQVVERLSILQKLAPEELQEPLFSAMRFASKYFTALDIESDWVGFTNIQKWPSSDWSNISSWKRIAAFLTKKSDGLVKSRLTKNDGFPTGSKDDAMILGISVSEIKSAKLDFQTTLVDFNEYHAFMRALATIKQLPERGYSDEQWRLMKALIHILKVAESYLKVTFSENGQSDFIEIALGADCALGEEDAPTDIALSLDYRIRHLLIDEFQDTSLLQYQLFEKLTAGWQNSDGHTFFAVGDPMQSIYRFREAQVGLFMEAREKGISDIELKPLKLTANFRSSNQIIQWVNKVFSCIFPVSYNIHLGAVSYSPSEAVVGSSNDSSIVPHFFIDKNPDDEAQLIAELCEQSLQCYPEENVGILIRTKAQAGIIVKALQKRNLVYSAIDIDRLNSRQVVKDIMALLRAMLHPADRINWLAVLRAPWCGLTLSDIQALLNNHKHTPVWELISDADQVSLISEDGQLRLKKLQSNLAYYMKARLREDISPWLEYIWHQIGGHACINYEEDLQAAQTCFETIREFESSNSLLDDKRLTKVLHETYAPAAKAADIRIQIMSIHKSKGLEFGTVIMPGLNRQSSRDQKKLLNWVELAGEDGASDLLLAPMDEAGEKEPILNLVMETERTKASNELLRLLYVACTRAKSRLHLMAHLELNVRGELIKPRNGSLLNALEPAVQSWLESVNCSQADETLPLSDRNAVTGFLSRLPHEWEYKPVFLPNMPNLNTHNENVEENLTLDFLWASDVARQVGVVVHRQLQYISESNIDQWDTERIDKNRIFYERMLVAEGVSPKHIEEAGDRVVIALSSTLQDKRGRWILDQSHHSQVESELALTGEIGGKIVNTVIDRTFIDAEGIRWIIDYKTGIHEGSGMQDFLEKEVLRYKPQLERYATLMRAIDDRSIMLALYFPMMGAWQAWQAQCPVDS